MEHLPCQVSGEPAARSACPQYQSLTAALPRVVQEGCRCQIGQGDALCGEGDRDVEQRGSVVNRVHRRGLDLVPELLQQRVVLRGEEALPVVEEGVRPECLQRGLDDPQTQQAGSPGPDLAPVPRSRSQHGNGVPTLVEPAGLPSLLPGLARELAQVVQEVPCAAASVPSVVGRLRRPCRAHSLRDLLDGSPCQIALRARRDRRN